jgi:ABC-type Co2+ transport system permease subunit
MRRHWSDVVFGRLRRLMGLRTELMVLTVAEVVALSYYGGLAAATPDPVLRAGFAASGVRVRAPAFVSWWLTAVGATMAVTADHGPLLDALGYRRKRFVLDVLIDFAAVARAALG